MSIIQLKRRSFWSRDQSCTNWQLCDISCEVPSHLLWAKKKIIRNYNFFPLKTNFNHSCALNIINGNMFLYNPYMKQIYYVINNRENESLWNRQYRANWWGPRKVPQCCQFFVSQKSTSKILNFLIFDQIWLKLSLISFSLFFSSAFVNTR